MEIIEGNVQNFDDLIKGKDVLVDFYATWCGPCKMLAPELEKIKDKIQIVKIDIDNNLELCKRYGVMSVPTLIHFKSDGSFNSNIGYINSDDIDKFIKA